MVNEADADQLNGWVRVAAIVLGAKTYRMFAADYRPYADPASELAAVLSGTCLSSSSLSLASALWGADDSAELLRMA